VNSSATGGSLRIEDHGGGVAVIHMESGENRFNPDFLDGFGSLLDEIEGREGPRAVVLTGDGKFFSNGLDIDWLSQADDQGRRETLARIYELLARLLQFPAPLAAAMNGHSFGAGAMMALACDWRVMRADRGFFCLPEIDIGLVFVPGMNALITSKLSGLAARDSMLTGRRFDGPAAEAAGIVDAVATESEVVSRAAALVEPLAAKPGHVFAGIRRGMYEAAIESLLAEAKTAREG
jgi:enoyl-CoA hydratase/carnithine racemase